jgi:hypothetical protein
MIVIFVVKHGFVKKNVGYLRGTCGKPIPARKHDNKRVGIVGSPQFEYYQKLPSTKGSFFIKKFLIL